MEKRRLERYLAGFGGVDSGYPFGPEALVFKVMGKMFALVAQKEEPPRVTLKCPPADAGLLVAQYESVVPGYYMNKRHWITISLNGELPDDMLMELADQSYELVISKLTRAEKSRLVNQGSTEQQKEE